MGTIDGIDESRATPRLSRGGNRWGLHPGGGAAGRDPAHPVRPGQGARGKLWRGPDRAAGGARAGRGGGGGWRGRGGAGVAPPRRIFGLSEEAEQLLAAARGLERGHLRVGADAPYHILASLSRFVQRYPKLRLSLSVGNSETLIRD